jgi:hypothetical protein
VVWAADLTGHGPFGELMAGPRLHEALDEVAGHLRLKYYLIGTSPGGRVSTRVAVR